MKTKKETAPKEIDPSQKKIIIHSNKDASFDVWFTMPKDKARICYYGNGGSPQRSYSETAMYIDSEKMCVSNKIASINLNTSGAFYTTYMTNWGFTYDKKTKKVKKWFGSNIQLTGDVIKAISDNFIDIEWLNDIHAFIHTLSTSDPLLGQVLSGKITNGRDLIKRFLKTNARGIEISPELLYKFIKSNPSAGSAKHILATARYCKNPNILFDPDFSQRSLDYGIFADTIKQARQLNRLVDLKWSNTKLNEVHKLWTREIMAVQLKYMEDFNVHYTGNLPGFEGFTLIGNQKEVFNIGTIQDHCVYTNFWNIIQNKTYFIMHGVYKDVVYTCGITRSQIPRNMVDGVYPDGQRYDYKYTISQLQCKRNGGAPQELRDLFNTWLDNPDVQRFFTDNYAAVTSDAVAESIYLQGLPF